MMMIARFAAATAAFGCVAAPAAAQSYQQQSYPQQYQQTYPQQYQQTYPQQYQQPYSGYGYNQGYQRNTVGGVIDQLLGNRYNVSDRQAVSQCASAAMTQAASQYGGRDYDNRYGGQYGHGYGQSHGASNLRVTAITDVRRRSNGLRVSGLMSSGYGGRHDYQNRGYGAQQVSFRCNVDYRGAVTNVRIGSDNGYRRY